MIIRSTEEILAYCQKTANDFCARFYPGLVVKVELSNLPLDKIGLAFRSWELDVPFIIMCDKTFCLLCSNRDYLQGIDDLILHEQNHAFLLSRGVNIARHLAGQHGQAFAAQANRVNLLLGFRHPVRSHRAWKKKRNRHTFSCLFWPFNERDNSKHTKICKLRRAALLRPVANVQAQARAWTLTDSESILGSLHNLVSLADYIRPLQDRGQLAALVRARQAVADIAARLQACGLLPGGLPVDTWALTPTPKPLTEEEQIRQAVNELIESTKGGEA
jgi:hypothetical protein